MQPRICLIALVSLVVLRPLPARADGFLSGFVGFGLVRPHAKLDPSSIASDQNTLGWDIGAGVNVYFGHTFGIRGDVRHVRTLQDITLGGVFSNAPLDFFRASAGVTLRF